MRQTDSKCRSRDALRKAMSARNRTVFLERNDSEREDENQLALTLQVKYKTRHKTE